MVLLMFRNGSIEEISSCTDVVHKEGRVVCLDIRGTPVASFSDMDLVYYTLNRECIQTIQKMGYRQSSPEPVPDLGRQPESVLERLWRMRKTKERRTHGPFSEQSH